MADFNFTWVDWLCIGTPLFLLLISGCTMKKSAKWLVTLFNVISLVIPIVLLIATLFPQHLKISEITQSNSLLWGLYTLAIVYIEILISKYKKLLPQTKESYEFSQSFSDIQNQWELVKIDSNRSKKREFINESLQKLKVSITCDDFYNNKLNDNDPKAFASTLGALCEQYICLSSSKKVFANEIFLSLYKYLFYEYKKQVLDAIRVSSEDSTSLIIPEFVSNGLTKTVIEHSNIVEYQYNTSVTSIKDFENNVGVELKGNPSNNFLRRIIITDEVDSPVNIDNEVFNNIITWHKKSKVHLRFISLNKANELMQKYSSVSCLDFSIIKMKNKEEFAILWADKIAPRPIAGQNQEMYSVKCMFATSQPDADKLFAELWGQALIGEITGTMNAVFKNS